MKDRVDWAQPHRPLESLDGGTVAADIRLDPTAVANPVRGIAVKRECAFNNKPALFHITTEMRDAESRTPQNVTVVAGTLECAEGQPHPCCAVAFRIAPALIEPLRVAIGGRNVDQACSPL